MTLPRLQRIKVSSTDELRNWLAKQNGHTAEVMIVTCAKSSKTKHVPGPDIRATLRAFVWHPDRSYTLAHGLEAHVMRPA